MALDCPPVMGKLDDVARRRLLAWINASTKTQADLAREIGRNQAWMSRYLDGEFDADLDTLQRMAVAFDHALPSLLETPPDPRNAEVVEFFNAIRPEARGLALDVLREWANPPRTKGRTKGPRGAAAGGDEAAAAAKPQ